MSNLVPFSRAKLAGALALVAILSVGAGPCGPIAGGKLSGNEVDSAVTDWSFAKDGAKCAIESRLSSPHSVTVACIPHEGRLFVGCWECASKSWSGYVAREPEARIQIGNDIYPVLVKRAEDSGLTEAIWRTRAERLGEEATSLPDTTWFFELSSR